MFWRENIDIAFQKAYIVPRRLYWSWEHGFNS